MRRSIDSAVKYAPVAAEDKGRLKHYLVFTLCGVPTMLVFLLVNLNKGNQLLCSLILASAAGLIISWFKILTLKNCRIIFRINSILFGILLIYMFIFGGEDGSKSLWMFIFPLIVFLLLGKKEGIVWAGSMLLHCSPMPGHSPFNC
jgi:phosphatidylserine synthase